MAVERRCRVSVTGRPKKDGLRIVIVRDSMQYFCPILYNDARHDRICFNCLKRTFVQAHESVFDLDSVHIRRVLVEYT